MVGDKRKASYIRILSKTFFIKNPLDGVGIETVKGLISIGADADSSAESMEVGVVSQFPFQPCGFHGEMLVVADGGDLFLVRNQETVADIIVTAEDFLGAFPQKVFFRLAPGKQRR